MTELYDRAIIPNGIEMQQFEMLQIHRSYFLTFFEKKFGMKRKSSIFAVSKSQSDVIFKIKKCF
jgi:hypothetical protein